jgi:hypothetical protein
MDMEHKRIIGMVDGKEAAIQQIWKELSTRRYAYLIYDDQYGNDMMNKVGNTDLTQDYLDNDIPAMIVKSKFVCKLPSGISVDNYAARRAACSSAIRCR